MSRIDTSSLGGRLRYARIRSGKTQEQVAHRLRGIDQPTVSRWELNETEPTASQVRELCDFLGVTVSWALGIGRPKRDFMQAKKP